MSEKIEVMRQLSDWFKKYNWKPYFNQKNSDNYPIFHANTNSKADLLLRKNGYCIGVEVKPGVKHQDILNGVDQTWAYAGEYYTGRASYNVDGKELNINAFVLATKFSSSGFLYSNEDALNYLNYENLKQLYGMTEKPITHSITRILWREWDSGLAAKFYEQLRKDKLEQKIRLPTKPFIGIIVAKTFADNRQIDSIPYLYLNSNLFIPMHWYHINHFENQSIDVEAQ